MRIYKNPIFKLIAYIFGTFLFCEYFIYYFVVFQCNWPILPNKNNLPYLNNERPVYAMFLADTHLLGKRNGHWFDKLRREWQMYRSFQSAITIFQPEIVFVLGDIFDEGLWCSGVEFNEYVERFKSLFYTPHNIKIYTVVGNHDIGFHYRITPYLAKRFEMQMNSSPVEMISIRGNHFILINSMAMEGDGCFLCSNAETVLHNITSILRCSRGIGICHNVKSLNKYSRPILLQHFPLYRISDEICTESDAAPIEERSKRFRERWECLSRESTEFLIDNLQPRVALGGHTHHACFVQHSLNKPSTKDEHLVEYSIPSFSWRYRNDPSFLLGAFTPNDYKISKCKLPKENTVIMLYIFSAFLLLFYMIFTIKKRYRLKYQKYI